VSSLWEKCPQCRTTAYEVELGRVSPWSIEQVCSYCGHTSPDLHFTAEPEPVPVPVPKPDTF